MGLFSEIPRHNQRDILKKLDFEHFIQFKQCSKETVKLTKHFMYPLHLKVTSINCYYQFTIRKKSNDYELECVANEPVRLEVETFNVYSKMPEEQLEFFKEFCHKKKLAVKKLHVNASYKDHKNGPSIIDNLIKVDRLIFTYGPIEESDFLRLEQPQIELYHLATDRFTSTTINKFLRQWTEERRKIRLFSSDLLLNFDELLKDLEISVLWSPESNESSIFDFSWTQEKEAKPLKILALERKRDGKRITLIPFEDRIQFIHVKEYENTGEIEEFVRSYCGYS